MAETKTARTQLGVQLTSVVDSEQTLSADLDLQIRHGALVEVIINSDQGSPQDAIICRVRFSLNGTNYGTDPWQEFTVGPPPDGNDFQHPGFLLPGGLWFVRFGFLSEGSNDTYTVDVFVGTISGI